MFLRENDISEIMNHICFNIYNVWIGELLVCFSFGLKQRPTKHLVCLDVDDTAQFLDAVQQ